MVINTNQQAMGASTLLMQSSSKLAQSLARLSSGSKINSPADDSAGLAVSTGTISNAGVVTFGGASNAIALGANLAMSGQTLNVSGFGTGTVTTLTSGTGITLTPATITSTGTINNTGYAGLTSVLSGLSSTVDGVEADAWTPTAINTTATVYNTSATASFFTNFFEIMSTIISKGNRFSATENQWMIDGIFMTQAMYIAGQTQIAAKQSFLLTGKVGKGATYGIGSDPQTGITHNGIPLFWDNLIPANTAYGLNFSQIWIDKLPTFQISGDSTSQINTGGPVPENLADAGLFETEVKYNDGRRAVTVSATFPGQIRINPRYQVMAFAGA